MEKDYLHIAGPIYVSLTEESPYEPQRTIKNFSEQWLRDYFAGLDTLSSQLPALLDKFELYQLGLMIKHDGTWISDLFYHDIDMPEYGYESIRNFIEALITCTPKTQYRDMLWGTAESNLGQEAISLLALRQLKDVKQFIRYMESCDLNHEVEHGEQFEQVVKKHGWTLETVVLWVSRNGNNCGQHGDQTIWQSPQADTIQAWIEKDASHQLLVIKAIVAHTLEILRYHWKLDLQIGFGKKISYLQEKIEALDITEFFSLEVLEQQGIGYLAETITTSAKVAAMRHLKAGTIPDHWLNDIL